MKKILSRLLLVCVLTSLVWSCTKSGNEAPAPVDKPVKLVKKVSSSTVDFVSYEYNTTGNVTGYISQWQDATGSLYTLHNVYEYDGDKLVKFSNEAGYAIYSYANNVIQKAEHFTHNNKKLTTLLYSFSNGKLASVIEQINNPEEDAIKETKISYDYYNNGNVSRMDVAYRKELTDSFTINLSKMFVEYDNKKNPEPDGVIGFFLPGVLLHLNNPVRVETTLSDGSMDSYTRCEYVYNTEGFPTQRKQFAGTGTTEHAPITFQYNY